MATTKIVLKHWQAAELFFRVCIKYLDPECKDLTPELLSQNGILDQLINFFSKKKPVADAVTDRILLDKEEKPFEIDYKLNEQKTSISFKANLPPVKNSSTSHFYSFAGEVKHGGPVKMNVEEYRKYMAFIGDPDTILGENVEIWAAPSKTIIKLQRTKWLLYHFAKHSNIYGLLEGVLSLELFHYAELDVINLKSGVADTYTGTWELKGEYLLLDMKLKHHTTRQLTMQLYWGDNTPNIALGQYHNIIKKIYSGAIILIPYDDVIQESRSIDTKGRFIPFEQEKDSNFSYIPKEVWRYCQYKNENTLTVPSEITSVKEFDSWKKTVEENKKKKQS